MHGHERFQAAIKRNSISARLSILFSRMATTLESKQTSYIVKILSIYARNVSEAIIIRI